MAQEDAMTVKWHRIKKKNTNLRHSNLPVFIFVCLSKLQSWIQYLTKTLDLT